MSDGERLLRDYDEVVDHAWTMRGHTGRDQRAKLVTERRAKLLKYIEGLEARPRSSRGTAERYADPRPIGT